MQILHHVQNSTVEKIKNFHQEDDHGTELFHRGKIVLQTSLMIFVIFLQKNDRRKRKLLSKKMSDN